MYIVLCLLSRRSVEYVRTVSENPESMQEKPESMQENPESMQENPESIQENPENIQENPESIQECNTRIRELKPMYQLTPVDRYGDSLEGVSYLDNEGVCVAVPCIPINAHRNNTIILLLAGFILWVKSH